MSFDEDMEEDQLQSDQNWRPNSPDKWDMITSGKWIQKAVWNRMVNTMERDQPHKTPGGHLHMDSGLSDKGRGGTPDGR